MSACTWNIACTETAQHHVECQSRPGLILDDEVCDTHLHNAQLHGYTVRGSVDGDVVTKNPS